MFCPFKFSAPSINKNVDNIEKGCQCEKGECSFWIHNLYTTEGISAGGMCSIRAQAMSNSEGLIVV